MWLPEVARFAHKWNEWKSSLGLYDFSDMIELALQAEKMPCHYVTGNKSWAGPTVMIGDEFQDFTRAEIKLFDHWAKQVDISIKVGDVDQQLYWFKGATPDSMSRDDLPDMNKRVLKQSHRVPQKVHKLAVRWINQIKGRIPIEYLPTEEEGKLLRMDNINFNNIDLPLLRAIEKDLADGRSVGIMASCDYMVRPTLKALRHAGLPFCNSYARNRGHYNPLTPGKGISASQRLLAYMRPAATIYGDKAGMWAEEDLVKWATVLDSKQALLRGSKKLLEGMKSPDQKVSLQTLRAIFKPEALAALLSLDLWDLEDLSALPPDVLLPFVNVSPEVFQNYIMQSKKASFEYPFQVAKKQGVKALEGPFHLQVGTIHSFKGGEFDSVYVFPDLSYKGYQGLEAGGEHYNSIIRMFYVAFTRSKYKLTILGAENNKFRVVI
jgi:DNA helicase-2/ATP-dependent DNA helicase PcrA